MAPIAALPFALTLALGAQEPELVRPEVAVTVVTLDELRQGQEKHGRALLEGLGRERWGRFRWAGPAVAATRFSECEDRHIDHGLDYCVRYYLTRAELPADAPPTVVVVFSDDQPPTAPRNHRGGEMRVVCYGRGVVASEPKVQDTWLWPGSFRIHGVNDLNRDQDALAACIAAAASEPWTGLRQPDVD